MHIENSVDCDIETFFFGGGSAKVFPRYVFEVSACGGGRGTKVFLRGFNFNVFGNNVRYSERGGKYEDIFSAVNR